MAPFQPSTCGEMLNDVGNLGWGTTWQNSQVINPEFAEQTYYSVQREGQTRPPPFQIFHTLNNDPSTANVPAEIEVQSTQNVVLKGSGSHDNHLWRFSDADGNDLLEAAGEHEILIGAASLMPETNADILTAELTINPPLSSVDEIVYVRSSDGGNIGLTAATFQVNGITLTWATNGSIGNGAFINFFSVNLNFGNNNGYFSWYLISGVTVIGKSIATDSIPDADTNDDTTKKQFVDAWNNTPELKALAIASLDDDAMANDLFFSGFGGKSGSFTGGTDRRIIGSKLTSGQKQIIRDNAAAVFILGADKIHIFGDNATISDYDATADYGEHTQITTAHNDISYVQDLMHEVRTQIQLGQTHRVRKLDEVPVGWTRSVPQVASDGTITLEGFEDIGENDKVVSIVTTGRRNTPTTEQPLGDPTDMDNYYFWGGRLITQWTPRSGGGTGASGNHGDNFGDNHG